MTKQTAALLQARKVLRSLSFKDSEITKALELISVALADEKTNRFKADFMSQALNEGDGVYRP